MTPPRLLLRRALAFGIDHTLAVVLVGLLVLPFRDLGLRLPQTLIFWRTSTCQPLDSTPDWLAAQIGGAPISVLRLCENRAFGLDDGRDLLVVYEPAPDQAQVARVPLRADLTPAPWRLEGAASLAVLVVLGLVSGAMVRAGGQTPGKVLLRLRLEGPRERAFAREIWRLLPLTLPALVTLAASAGVIAPPILWSFDTVLAVALGAAALALWYVIWPFWRWTGQSRHDGWSGFFLRG